MPKSSRTLVPFLFQCVRNFVFLGIAIALADCIASLIGIVLRLACSREVCFLAVLPNVGIVRWYLERRSSVSSFP